MVREADGNVRGIILFKFTQLLAYADGTDIWDKQPEVYSLF